MTIPEAPTREALTHRAPTHEAPTHEAPTQEAPDVRRKHADAYRWEGIDCLPYKEDDGTPFKAISRQILFADPHQACELRYFEVAAGGYSTLERHEHTHAVMILRGEGQCLVGLEVRRIGTHDLVTVPPWTWHQFRANRNAPLGFLCMVNRSRDRPQLPTPEDLAQLRSDASVAAFLASSG